MTRQAPSVILAAVCGFLSLTPSSCGDDKGTETETDTDSFENEYCDQPNYPTDSSADNSCGCGYSAAFHEKDNPYYLQCVGESCGIDGECLPKDRQPICLWDGDGLTSPGSFCGAPCGAGQSCPVVDGIQTTCQNEFVCLILCNANNPCPQGMLCTENASAPGIGADYCIYDFSP